MNGYHVCEAVILTKKEKHPISVYSEIYSCQSDNFISKNKYTKDSIDTVRSILNRKCNMVFDRGYDDNKIIDYIKKRYNNIKDIIIISSIKNYNMDHLYNTILKYGIDKKIYFVGSTNSGKSTLINKLIKDYGNNDITITTSMYPSTTLDAINIKLNGLNIYDTPGIVNEGSITNYINNNELKKINIKKEIKPITYQIKDKCSILVGDYIRLDFECISTSITIYISNNVPVKRISINNPILLDNITSSYNDLKNKDIVIEDICFIKITKNTRVNIYGKYNLSTIIRDNLI